MSKKIVKRVAAKMAMQSGQNKHVAMKIAKRTKGSTMQKLMAVITQGK